jgi:predicted AAA+ superfamily ATPase
VHIARYLKLELPKGQSCFLWGARKTGKSTYLKERFPNAIYIDLLKADVYQKYLKHPERLREELQAKRSAQDTVIIIDEVQKVPLLLDEVHCLIESYSSIQFILCGSSVRKLKRSGANLLGGRAWRFLFQPLCYSELKKLDWDKIFNHGLIPSHYLATSNVKKFLASYLYDYIVPEVEYEANLRKRETFVRFLDVLGHTNGEMVVYNNIARESGVDAKTVKSYFDILEDMYLGYYLHPYRSKAKRQTITETPKFYLFDTGIANYLRGYKYDNMQGSDAGRAFEHYVFLELMAYKNLCERDEAITYWRTKEGYEIDFIFQEQAVEVKLSYNINNNHIKNLLQFSRDHSHRLNIVCLEEQKRVIQKGSVNITIWPIEEFLSELWAHKVWMATY